MKKSRHFFACEKITKNHNRCDFGCFFSFISSYCLLLSYSCYWWNTFAINGQSSNFFLHRSLPLLFILFFLFYHSQHSSCVCVCVWWWWLRAIHTFSIHVLTCCDSDSACTKTVWDLFAFLESYIFLKIDQEMFQSPRSIRARDWLFLYTPSNTLTHTHTHKYTHTI